MLCKISNILLNSVPFEYEILNNTVLVRAGRVTPDLALNLTKYMSLEEDYLPWFSADKLFTDLDTVLQSTDYYGDFRVRLKLSL